MKLSIKGIKGKDFVIDQKDSLCMKLSMLIEGHCTIGIYEAIKKYGYTDTINLINSFNITTPERKRGAASGAPTPSRP